MKVIGYIARRRCIGRNLAFADIHVESEVDGEDQNRNDSQERIIQIIFHRESAVWNQDLDDTFPNKNSKLPHGGKVFVEAYLEECMEDVMKSPSYLVRQWQLLENPHKEAMEQAKSSNGISCTVYLKSRGDAFLRFNDNTIRCQPKPEKARREKSLEFSHGDNRAKALRAKIFASWLLDTYGQEFLQNGGVLDVAGGKGKLSIELAVQGGIPCTIVDPLVRKHGANLEPRDAKRIRKVGAPHPQLVAKPFDTADFVQEANSLIQTIQICVGLHPDECTEDIVDVALQFDKPLAIVPCCVFSGFFPLRTIQDPETKARKPVRTYEEFVTYLLAKDERLQKTSLPFEGRNIVIFRLPQ